MAQKKRPQTDKTDQRPIPFDEALRRLVKAPPQHRPAKKPRKGKKSAKKG